MMSVVQMVAKKAVKSVEAMVVQQAVWMVDERVAH